MNMSREELRSKVALKRLAGEKCPCKFEVCVSETILLVCIVAVKHADYI